MKLSSLFCVMFLLAVSATGADFLKPRWKVSEKDQVYTIRFDKGKGGFMQGILPMKAGEYALVSFDAVMSGNDGTFSFSSTGFADKNYNSYHKQTLSGKGKYCFAIYAPEDTAVKLQLNLRSSGGDVTMTVSNLNVKKFTAFDKLDLSEYELLNSSDAVSRVPAEDHLEGGFASKIVTGEKRAKGASLKFPLLPGKKYKMTFWAKASKPTRFDLWVDGWTPKQKHWYVPFRLSAETEFKLYEVEFTSCPELPRYRGLACAVFQLTPNCDLTVKGLKIEQVGK